MDKYPFRGLPLGRTVSKDLLKKYWNKIDFLKPKNKVVSFGDLHFHLKKYHEINGGDISSSKVQAIIREFANENPQLIRPTPVKGKWIINPTDNEIKPAKSSSLNKNIKKKEPTNVLKPLNIYGSGRYFVYVFYNEKDKVCKVGKTKGTIKTRFNSLKTGMAEDYTHPILVQFENETDMKNYEKTMEYVLKYKECHKRGEFYNIEIKALLKIMLEVNRILKINKSVKAKS